jgi:hypothetical protein
MSWGPPQSGQREQQKPDENGMLVGKIHHELPERAQAYEIAVDALGNGMGMAEMALAAMGGDVLTLCDLVVALAPRADAPEVYLEQADSLRSNVLDTMQSVGEVTQAAAFAYMQAKIGPPWTKTLTQSWVIFRARLGEDQS